jgi:3-dehydroquinate synthase
MHTVTVRASKTYEIIIETGLLTDAGARIKNAAGGQVAAIITDDRVAALYAPVLSESLEKNGYRVVCFAFPHGESSKNAGTWMAAVHFLAETRLSRSDVVVALGGGVTGDLAGFAAACYLRGIPWVQVPTTLLAMVDSSVGGKTGVNLPQGKNLMGAFYQPALVLCDPSLLSTAGNEVFADGCAEMIKYGVIADRALFDALAEPSDVRLASRIARCVEIKRDIVEKDEYEVNERKLLNFGHTVGHAIEKLSGYAVPHGHAVAAGMAVITRAAAAMRLCDTSCADELTAMLASYGLPHTAMYPADALFTACLYDKKSADGSITLILPTQIGKCLLRSTPLSELKNILQMGLEG